MPFPSDGAALARRLYRDVGANLRFFTRLPIPSGDFGAPDWPRIAWAAPLAGAIVGLIGALALEIGHALLLPLNLTAIVAIAVTTAVTGALHEDGLADVADGFGGGATREAKLAIMRDSRIGTFGAVALILAMLLRVGALTVLLRQSAEVAGAALVLGGAVARAAALAPLALLPPARPDGAGATAGALDGAHLIAAALGVVVIALLMGLLALDVMRALFAVTLAGASAWGVCAWARRQIGGQTGDVAGTAALAAEIVALTGLLIGGRGA